MFILKKYNKNFFLKTIIYMVVYVVVLCMIYVHARGETTKLFYLKSNEIIFYCKDLVFLLQ